jgi:very-short-patch-repair endonuclease
VDSTPKNFARTLRRNQTEAEKRLWRKLRSRDFQGVKFRRQQPLGPYVADFCSFQNKMIIELDGGQHALAQEEDEKRTAYLKRSGFQVIRVWDNEVLNKMEGVLEYIRQSLKSAPLTPALSRKGRGGKEKR